MNGITLQKRIKKKDLELLIELMELFLEIIKYSSFVSVAFLGISNGKDFINLFKFVI